MRYPAAAMRPGPANKVNGGVNACRGVVCHSMVGYVRAALGELDNPLRRASWHYSVLQNGTVLAHYQDEAQTWHAGSSRNNDLIGIEHEGGFDPEDEPLTPAQRDASVALVRWLSQAHGFPLARGDGLFEHNEVSGSPTACPSNRIPWDAYVEEPEDEMKSFMAWVPQEQREYLIGPNGAVPILYPALARELEAVFGPMQIALSGDAIKAIGVVK